MKDFEFKCSCCDEVHKGMPHLGASAPIYYFGIPKEEKSTRAILTSDTCVLDSKEYFVRGCLEMPVIGYEDYFSFGAWVSLTKDNFFKFERLLDEQDREQNDPMFGWFSTRIWTYEGLEELKTLIHFRNDGIRPFIELEPTEHPLSVGQREGIEPERIIKIYEYYVHGKE